MLSFSDLSIQPVIDFFQAHPNSAGIITYFVIFLEALAVVGMFVPGTIIMPAIGFLIGAEIIPASGTILCAISGALTADYLSYFIGVYFKDRIHLIWPFSRWPNLLDSGEKYFRAHGGKSIFIGRFFGPTRAIIPMVAGMLKMPFSSFAFASLPSAIFWVASYIIPGILLGALSLELPAKVAAKLMLWVLLILTVLWIIVWLTKHFFKKVWNIIDHGIHLAWKFCQKNKKMHWFYNFLVDPKKPNCNNQLTMAIIAFFLYILFFFIIYQVVTGGFLTYLDKPIYYLLKNLRSVNLDEIAVLITLMGDSTILLISAGVFLTWLMHKRYFYTAAHWVGAVVLSVGTIGMMKFLMYFPRPMEVLYEKYMSSFPSAHTALSLVFFGFVAVIIARKSKNQNNTYVSYTIVGVLVGLVILSRLYLGVHWLSDILGSACIGLAIILLVVISYRHHHVENVSAHKIAVVSVNIFIITWLSCSIFMYHRQVEEYSLIWPKQTVSVVDLLKRNRTVTMPLFRSNRLGQPIEVFNVEWIGSPIVIEKHFVANGWKSLATNFDFRNILKSFFDSSSTYHLPILPQLYHNKPPVLVLTKETDKDNVILLLRLWESEINLSDVRHQLLLGSIEHYNCHEHPNAFSIKYFKNNLSFVGVTDVFSKYLKDFKFKTITYSQGHKYDEMEKISWDGKVLVVY